MKKFLDELLNQLDIAAVAFKIDAPGGVALTAAVQILRTQLAVNTMLSTKVKTV